MPDFKEHAPGTFCYCELASPDPQVSQRFYSRLFGWDFAEEETPHGSYTQFKLGGKITAALYKLVPEQIAQGVPPHWASYVSVADCDAATARVTTLGGTVAMGPMDVMDLGRMSVCIDPLGAAFCIWQPRRNVGVDVRDEPGAMCWHELMTTDTDRASAFYGGVFGWETGDMAIEGFPPYHFFTAGPERWVGGMMAIQPEMGPIPPHWLLYFSASDLDAVHAKALELGGQSMVPPTVIPDHGRFAVIQDPQGVVFGLHEAREG
ncbi:VOC family protein [bacterium]|nr:VOC family protein [bacterium]